MSIDVIINYLHQYGYLIIFAFLFFGIVGIPAPEESLLFLIGLLIAQHRLHAGMSVLSAGGGALSGMLVAYWLGRSIGYPFIYKFGKYAGITQERWKKAEEKYGKNVKKTILFGFYMPGIRQISPYFAGIASVGFWKFMLLSLIGTITWIAPFIVLGYYAGQMFHLNPEYASYLGFVFLLVFLLYILIKWLRIKMQKRKRNR